MAAVLLFGGATASGEARPPQAPERRGRLAVGGRAMLRADLARRSCVNTSTEREDEDVRCSLQGNTFSVPVVGMLLGRGLFSAGLLAEPPTVAVCRGGLGPAGRVPRLRLHAP